MSVAFVNVATVLHVSGGTTLTGNQTLTTGTNIVAAVSVVYRRQFGGAIAISAATLDGVALTAVGAASAFSDYNVRHYILPAPTTGTISLSLTFDHTLAEAGAVTRVYSGVDQATPARAGSLQEYAANSDGSAHGSIDIPSATGDMTVAASASTGGSPTTNQTARTTNLIESGAYLLTDDAAGAASVNHTHNTFFAAQPIVLQGFSLAAATNTVPVLARHQYRLRRI